LKAGQGLAGGDSNVKAFACAAQVPVAPPADIALHLVKRIELVRLNQTISKAKSHGSVIGPLARLQVKWPTAHHVRDGFKGSRLPEFQSGPNGIADGQADQAPLPTGTGFNRNRIRNHGFEN
jgi:hypothetical protein